MPSKFAETTRRKVNWNPAPGLSEEARQAVDAAFFQVIGSIAPITKPLA